MSTYEAGAHQVLAIPALAGTSYTSKQQSSILDVSGRLLVTMSLVPSVMVGRAMSVLRKAVGVSAESRSRLIESAVLRFRDAEIEGVSAADYRLLTSRIAGLPATSVDYSIKSIVEAGRTLDQAVGAAMPRGVSRDWSDPALRDGGAIWVRRGNSLSIHASGNSPAIHASWLQALALGYRVAVRPSRRDPLTPHRLITALRQAGFSNEEVMMLPTDYGTADAIVRGADLSIVFGGADVVSRYVSAPNVLVNGPGLSKMLITADSDWREHLDAIVQAVSGGGGTSCGNVTGLFIEGDPRPLAEALSERLSAIPSLPPEHEEAGLPVVGMERAQEIEDYFLAKAAGAHIWLGADGIRDDLGDGSATLRPAVTEVLSADDPRVNIELAFPCVWVAPWSRADGVGVFDHTLSLMVITGDSKLTETLAVNPTIATLNVGCDPTALEGGHLPHDDYLGSFLMKAKAARLPT